jgi:hypothetical protein
VTFNLTPCAAAGMRLVGLVRMPCGWAARRI